MKKVLFIFLIFCFSLNIISCSSSSDEDDIEEILTPDTTAATLAEVTFVTTPTNDSTPNYTFSSSEAGTTMTHLTPTPVLYHVSSVCQHPPVIPVWRWY